MITYIKESTYEALLTFLHMPGCIVLLTNPTLKKGDYNSVKKILNRDAPV